MPVSSLLTPTQRDLYLDHLIDPESTTYSLGLSLDLGSDVDDVIWQAALEHVIAAEEVPGTRFLAGEGEPRQIFDAAWPCHFEVLELGHGMELKTLDDVVARHVKVPYDLENGPLFRNFLVKNGERRTAVLGVHHAVCDAFSGRLFFERLGAVYEALAAGREPAPPAAPRFSEAIAASRERFDTPEIERYWAERLAGVSRYEPAGTPTGKSGLVSRTVVAGAELEALRSVCADRELSPAAWWRAVYGLFLARYFDLDRDLLFYDVVAGRPSGHAGTIGCFYQVVPVVVDRERIRPEMEAESFVRYLRNYRRRLGDKQNLSVLLERRLRGEAGPRFYYNYYHFAKVELLGRRCVLNVHDSFPADEAHLIVSDNDSEMGLSLYGDAVLLGEAGHLERLVAVSEQLCGARRLGDVDVVLPVEHRQLAAWNETAWTWEEPADLRSLLVAQLAKTPDAPAVSFDDEALTYAELHRRVDDLARCLRLAGVGSETVVGVFLERSLDLVISLLAVIKAGGAYLPLDPDYPAERLAFMVDDAGADVVLTWGSWRDRLPGEARIVAVDATAEETELPALPKSTDPDQLAYVIYTSGSTGRPKGAMNSHRAIANRLLWMQEAYGLGPGDRVLQKTPFSFDVSVWEFFWPLMVGAELVVARPGGHRDASYLVRTIREREITTLHFVPSMLRLFLEDPEVGACSSIQRVIASGEALSTELRDLFFERLATAELHNLYGPTEAAVDVTFWDCRQDRDTASVPIGLPIANTRIQLRDRHGLLVPPGMPGELLIGGVAPARGYHRRPGLTAEKFVPDPLAAQSDGAQSGGRLYRTGDLARWRADGSVFPPCSPRGDSLEFLGRLDFQVKVRGLRIELGEIETALSRRGNVAAAVVTARERRPGDVELVAYLVLQDGAELDRGELAVELGRSLPDYMVPSAFVVLDELPLTPSGKVDRRALPEPTATPQAAAAFVAPRGEIEETVAVTLAEILGFKRLGVHDDIYDLGAHSLILARLAASLRQRLGLELDLAEAFQYSTVAELAAHLEGLATAERTTPIPPFFTVPRDGDLRLSFAQERVWFLHQMNPESLAYNIQFLAHFDGVLDHGHLEAALSEIVRRHEILRTSFPARDGRPVQVIHEPYAVTVPFIDLSGVPAAERGATLEGRVREEISIPFDVRQLPLARWVLFKLDERSSTLLQIEHHFVHDGWSVAVILRELREIYNALSRGELQPGEPSSLPAPGAQYADFVAWQRHWMRGEALEEQLAYWRDHLEGAPPLVQVPADRPRPETWSFEGDALVEELPEDLSERLRAFGRREGVTLFTTMAAALKVLLARLTGITDVPLGSGFANRRLRELETMIGMVVNSVVLRTGLCDRPSFHDTLRRTRQAVLDAHTHQDLPFDKLVEALQPERDPSYNPLFQVLFGFHDSQVPDLDFEGPGGLMRGRFQPFHNGSAKVDLNIVVIPRVEQRRGLGESALREETFVVWEFGTDLFDRSTMERYYRHYLTLLDAAIAQPDAAVSDLPLLTPSEQAQLLAEWNAPSSSYRGAPSLFLGQVERTPDDVAVDFADARWTYRELEARANRLARYMGKIGVGPETRVAVDLPATAERVMVFLAVLKAGAAYVPLDPSDPTERIRLLLDDSEAVLLVTRTSTAVSLTLSTAQVLCLDNEAATAAIEQEDPSAPDVLNRSESLAYIIYTSGSTGRPKGVAVSHGAIAHLVLETDYVRLTPADRVAQAANAAFDAVTFEIWGPLLNGAAVVGIRKDVLLSPSELAREIEERGITTLFLTTAVFNQTARELPEGFRPLKHLLFGGEACDPRLVRAVLEAGGPQRLVHVYGPTECTTFSSWHLVTEVPKNAVTVPIGLPVANATLHVLDDNLMPVPLGVAGELVIGADGLARGYFERPALTADRFIPDAYGRGSAVEPGGRLYRTGDRVRRRPDGAIEFLGRDDHQVKMRGFRIELGEIEAALHEHPAVAVAVVVSWHQDHDHFLAAYVVLSSPIADGQLAAYLEGRLPGYMVPSVFMELESLPLTPSGKLDRRALPVPERHLTHPETSREAPRGATEVLLAEIWGEVLGYGEEERQHLGRDDDFFELGGHSLLATQVVSKVRELFELELSLKAIFEASTVAGLARQIETAAWSRPAPPIERRRADEVPAAGLPLSFAQQRLWFLDRLVPDNPFYNLPFAWRLHGTLDVEALRRAFEEIVRRHEALRTTFPEHGNAAVQAVSPPEPLVLPVLDLGDMPADERREEARRLTSEELRRPIAIARELPFRVKLLRLSDEEAVLLVTLHHIVADGWSVGVLLRELRALYGACEAGGEPADVLPEPPVAYADFALWQRRWLAGEVLEHQLDYWHRRLGGAPALELPTDRSRPAVQTFRGRRLEVWLDQKPTEALKEFSRSRDVTLFMTLLAAFKTLIHRLTGQTDLVVGSPIANRNRAEIEDLIGFFVNSLGLRSKLGGDPLFSELVAQVRDTALGAYAHQDLPFEKLVEELQPERDLGKNPIFQVMFALQNAPTPEHEMGGLRLERQPFEARVTRFDLEAQLWVEEEGLRIVLYYDLDLFDHSSLLRFERHFRTLLEGMAERDDCRLSELPLLGRAEAHQLLVEWNAEGPVSFDVPVHQLVERHAAENGDGLAVAYAWEKLCYGELNARANQLAHHLRGLGVGPESRVALLMEPCVEMIWGMLGVLKAGGAYLPMDPSYPRERIAYMLADAAPKALLTLGAEAVGSEDFTGPVLTLDMAFDLDSESDEDPVSSAGLDNVAYVIYTSGSTGRPKGVAVSHRGLANLVAWHVEAYGLGAGDRTTQVAGPGFDASVWEIWSALGAGAALYVADSEVRAAPREMVDWLVENEIDVSFLPTPMAEAVLREDWPPEPKLRALLTGGDLLHRGPAALARVPLFNQYGPTENAVVATAGRVEVDENADPPIGRPLPGVRVHLADARLEPVPAGAFGELCLGGESLARGYLGRPALTAERFVPNPYADRPGDRLYKTGDLGRLRGDGRIDFRGRRDHQVKVRGFRIELGEIEAVLEEHPAATAAVAAVHDGRLVAYLVHDPDYAPAEEVDETEVQEAWKSDQVSQWTMIFDDLYGREAPRADATFNTIGWNDTATGEPLPAAEMSEWLEDTVQAILALKPRQVLEIGCGTGMILYRVAPHCEHYFGTDISQQVLDTLESRRGLDLAQSGLPSNVTLRQATADGVSAAGLGPVDAVVLNSVVQYFPSADYLAEVVEDAVASVADGGAVFLGDLRGLALLEAFHDHVALVRAEDDWSLELLLQRARARQLREDELAVDPAFFHALAERVPRIVGVEIFPKRGRATNELTSFRYQVVLRVGSPAPLSQGERGSRTRNLDWDAEGLSLDLLRLRLVRGDADAMTVTAIPNARLDRTRAVRAAAAAEPRMTVTEIRQRLAEGEIGFDGGVEPEDLWSLAAELGYEMDWGWSRHDVEGRFDVVFYRPGTVPPPLPGPEIAGEGFELYANKPLSGRFARRVIPELRAFLGKRLPDHMVPASYVLLDELPLTPNGKVDRRALPSPDPVRPELAEGFVAPRTPEERTLAAIWAEILDLERVGAEDDFFDLGGHSLLATQVVSQARQAFEVELPLAVLFEAPTVAALAGRILELVAHAEPGAAEAPAIERFERVAAAELPISFAQQRLWFLDRLAPDNAFYNIPVAWNFEGALDVAVLRRCLDEVVRRHEGVRTRFSSREGEPLQKIVPPSEQPLPIVDLRGLDEAGRQAELKRLVNEEAVRPFDLARDALMRTTLVLVGDAEVALLLTLHHIVADGWSMGVLLRELQAMYPAFVAGEPSPLPELSIQYADFAVWQRRWFAGEVLERQLDYWREKLAGATVLELPLDRPRPTVQIFRGRRAESQLEPRLLEALRALGRQHDATLFMTLLAAFNAVLYRYTGQDDIVVGSPIAGRNRGEIEGLIGFFVNSLALRARVRGKAPFPELLDQVRETALGAYAHQDLPFEMLVEHVQPERDLSRNPLFQVSFGLHSAPMPELALGDLVVRQLPWELKTTRFDLEFHLWESPDGIRCVISYDRDLFDAGTIARLRGAFTTLLEGLAEEPTAAVADLPLIGAAEREQLIARSRPRARHAVEETLTARFEAQAARRGDAGALVFEDETMSYGELDRRANQLAHRLRDLGVGPEERVALLMERSCELVIAILGVLKAGGAYLPLDPTYPRERLAYTLGDAGARVLVSHSELTDRLAPQSPGGDPGGETQSLDALTVVRLDADAAEIAALPESAPRVLVDPDHLAYVIYTSGSTGRPKGTLVTHRNMARLFTTTDDLFAATGRCFGEDDVWTLFHSYAFDFSVWELWGALVYGGRLVVVPYWVSRSPESFYELLEREGVTVLNQTPTAFRQLLRAEAAGDGRELALRWVIFGGEALDPRFLAPWFERHGDEEPRLVNMYGITETTVHVTFRRLARADLERAWQSPVGEALPDLGVHLLDRWGRPVPPGAAGEIHVAGAGSARGYLDRPALTAERFVPDPFAAEPGARLYRAGDLARRTAAGELIFEGRADDQVKVRGFRIELGEIAAAIRAHAAVADAAVILSSPGNQASAPADDEDRRLVAYMVRGSADDGTETDAERADQVERWQMVFDDLYGQEAADEDPTFNIVGWQSHVTGEAIPAAEMREWLDDTIATIRALEPRRVLEIGCGTGMLLYRVAPICERYVGTDFSVEVLAALRAGLARAGSEWDHVELRQGAATDFSEVEPGSFDLVVINSVAQYFPSVDYLLEVLRGAVRVVAPGGAVFVGDLRSLPLLEAFHALAEIRKADGGWTPARFAHNLSSALEEEEELVLDPAFFAALESRLPGVARAEVFPKRGQADNELFAFRYQAVLRVGEADVAAELPWHDWQRDGLSISELRRQLREESPERVALWNIPNARLRPGRAILELLAEPGELPTVEDLRRALAAANGSAVDPEELWTLATELPYRVEVSWAGHGADGTLAAVLRRVTPADAGVDLPRHVPRLDPRCRELPWRSYATDPLRGQRARRLAGELRTFLGERLPDHMIPASYVWLDALPLTANGKLDRRALPAPEPASRAVAGRFTAPRNPIEESLAVIWKDVLGLGDAAARGLGVDDDFFDLGGHSLLATQVVSKVRRSFGVELPLRALFEAPTVASLARRIESTAGGRVAPPITPLPRHGAAVEDEQGWPLSFAQQRLWFVDHLTPGNAFYNMPIAWVLRGSLSVPALAATLNEILRRHEALRTLFPTHEGRARQVVEDFAPRPLPVIDLSGLEAEVRQAEAERLTTREAARPFHLATGPLLRMSLLRRSVEESTLLLTLHHIVSDGWSVGVLLAELRALYEAFAAGRPAPLPELPVQYVDFAVWQRRWLTGEVLDEQLAYWHERLHEAPALELPTDRPRGRVQTFNGRGEVFLLPADLSRDLADLSREHQATLFMTLLASFKVLLHRLTGQDDLVVGSPIANRHRSELEDLIGFFVNSLAMRTRVPRAASFAELLGAVRESALDAYAHQDLPFEKLVEHRQSERDLSRNPLFQVMFALQNAPLPALSMGELELRQQPYEVRTTRFDLEAHFWEIEDGLRGVFFYDLDLFDRATIQRWQGHLGLLLEGIVRDPSAVVADLPILNAAEERQLVEWNDLATAYPRDTTLDRLFARQVERDPDAVALVFGNEELTYGELDRRAEALAATLCSLGCGPEVLVGLAAERSAAMVVALVGIVKAGGAYVPLDPSYPASRLAFMIEDTDMPLLLAERHLAAALPESAARVLYLDELEDVERAPATAVAAAAERSSDQLAYVIYTSGSTGRPKGVAVNHRAVSRLVLESDYVRLAPDDRVAQASSSSFDAATFEIWGALLNGACLVGVDKETALEPVRLARVLEEQRVTTLFLTTALFNEIARQAPLAFAGLKHLLFGGEAVDPERVRRVLEQGPPKRLLHVYGPTESTTYSTWHRVREVAPDAVTVPIGRPIANSTQHVVDRRGHRVPVGTVGELMLGGDGLARGYLSRPALSAERFVPDAWSSAPGGRLYRTGDLVRLRADGGVEFVGRRDHQVKIRGFRIELGEIAAALESHPAVRDAVVMVRADEAGDRRLAAWAVPEPAGLDAVPEPAADEAVGEWQMIFDDLYTRDAPHADATFNTIGWDSTATGEAIPEDEMRQWLDDTLERIRALAPRRVLELGCGTGMLLFPIAPQCELYVGTDISQQVLDFVRAQCAAAGGLSHVSLEQRTAADQRAFEPGDFNLVVLNSVVQYFPSADYLAEVLGRAVEALAPGGAVFLGDVRSLPLAEAFHTAVARERAGAGAGEEEIRRRARIGMLEEEELLLDPAFFFTLKERLPRISRVAVFPKRGDAHNELTCFRYQVVLHVEDETTIPSAEFRLDWEAEALGLEALCRRLEESSSKTVVVTGIPNARVVGPEAGIDPQVVWALAGELPYEVELSWTRPGIAGRFDALLHHRDGAAALPAPPVPEVDGEQPLAAFANDPGAGRRMRRLVPELRRYLDERLPDYMVPAAWTLLAEMPLNANGKIDRRALPAPDQERAATAVAHVAPRTPTEETVASIWGELLGVTKVSVADDFFELGGHSLLATQVASRLRDTFRIELALGTIFSASTLERLAEEIDAARWIEEGSPSLFSDEDHHEDLEEMVL